MDTSEQPQPKPLRLFISVALPQRIKAAIENQQAELRRALSSARITWTAIEQLHLTLRFLGNVQGGQIQGLTQTLQEVCGNFSPVCLQAKGIGVFPNPRSPRVIWVGVKDEAQTLARLQMALVSATNTFTHEPSNENFTGHVTLGRIKFMLHNQAKSWAELASDLSQKIFGDWTALGIDLMLSQLSPHGACHTTLATIPFKTNST